MQGMAKVKGKRDYDNMAIKAMEILNIGQKIKVKAYARDHYNEKAYLKTKRTGTVIAFYPHVFLCDMGGYKEAFRYGQLFCLENERVVL